jgi:hypothetical protein
MEVCFFHFPFAANKRTLPFSISSHFCIYIYIETGAYINSYTSISIYLHIAIYILYTFVSNENWKPRQFSFTVYCSVILLTEVCRLSVCLFVYEETNWSYLHVDSVDVETHLALTQLTRNETPRQLSHRWMLKNLNSQRIQEQNRKCSEALLFGLYVLDKCKKNENKKISCKCIFKFHPLW